ncbi:MAG TPA: trans-aconitate 2-methyltransferase [Roseiarcus sp.]|nr:trans-aconitate 2-methyltransferase [Roseiarcus sp.]
MARPSATPVAEVSARPESDWDTTLYLKFEAERTQPARDLLARVEVSARRIVDLGCGPGTSTRLLAERFPQAEIIGVDNSEPMLAEARRRLPEVHFELSNIANWRPRQRPDLIFANAALQWLPDHEALFKRLMSYLAEDGALAVQMPDNRQEPSHALMRLVAADGPWADRLVPIAKTRAVIATHVDYYAWLRPLSAALDIWETTYVHPMAGVGAVVDWFRGSALRPFLNPLDVCEREQFIERYMRELALAYGVESDGSLLFLYPRLFILARKRAGRA